MIKACIVTDCFYNQNRLFDISDKNNNRDNCLYPFYILKERLKEVNIVLATSDINTIKDSDIIIYNEMPASKPCFQNSKRKYLIILESEIIKPGNWGESNHAYFDKVFTWNDDLVDNEKYIKINFSYDLPTNINKSFEGKKLCTLIAGNKKNNHYLELYSKRVEAIRWFEKNKPNDFDLYGLGWDEFYFTGSRPVRLLNKIKLLVDFFKPYYPSYRGKVSEKKSTLEKYKFAICYENAKDIPGYITEKIFDCFFAGCIPIYWGANNVSDHIPEGCYIDRRLFNTHEGLYDYISSINESEYLERLSSIECFLTSDKAKQFSSEFFARTIIDNIKINL